MSRLSLHSPRNGKSQLLSPIQLSSFKITADNPQRNTVLQSQKSITNSTQNQANPFQALSEFKSTQNHYEMLRKRLQVLKIKDHKNNNRYHINQRRLIFHDQVQKINSLQKQKIQEWKELNQLRKHQQKIKNFQQKLVHHRNISSIIETIKQNKMKQYALRKEQSQNNQQKIIKMQLQSLSENKNKVEKIKQIQSFSKASLQAYNRSKQMGFKQKKNNEAGSLNLRKLRKQQQIKKMMQLQMQMIQKQSTSRLILDKSKQRLKQILNPETNLKSSRMKKNNQSLQSTEIQNNDHNSNKSEEVIEKCLQSNLTNALTRQSSILSQGNKKQFSLPQINNFKKYHC